MQAGGCEFDDYQVASILKLTKDFLYPYHFRIKPETKRIALNQQDLIDRELSGKTMRVRKADSDFDSVLITLISKIGIAVYDCQQIITYEELKENFYWLDNSPCYKDVNCDS